VSDVLRVLSQLFRYKTGYMAEYTNYICASKHTQHCYYTKAQSNMTMVL